jgi:hypothetical protein
MTATRQEIERLELRRMKLWQRIIACDQREEWLEREQLLAAEDDITQQLRQLRAQPHAQQAQSPADGEVQA